MRLLFFVAILAVFSSSRAKDIDAVLAYPPVDAFFSCTEHFDGQFQSIGDALGTDCVVTRLIEQNGRIWSQSHEGDGVKNEQWYGWHEHLLAPCTCKVVEVYTNPKVNEPGIMGEGHASSITFRRKDGVEFLYAHVREVSVKEGQPVEAGQPVAMIGNNGYARNPHVHVGAWKGNTPLQIRWDQRKMRLPPEFREEKSAGAGS